MNLSFKKSQFKVKNKLNNCKGDERYSKNEDGGLWKWSGLMFIEALPCVRYYPEGMISELFSVEGLIRNIPGFVGRTVSVTTTKLCGFSVKVDDR